MQTIATNIDYPTKENCGNCHLSSDHTHYNDLPKEAANDNFVDDMHMAPNMHNFRCRTCHTTFKHMLSLDCVETSMGNKHQKKLRGDGDAHKGQDMSSCEACHSEKPHKDGKVNDHTDVVSCQACHIDLNNAPVDGATVETEFIWYNGLTSAKTITHNDKNEKITLRNSPMPMISSTLYPFIPWFKTTRKEYKIQPFKVVTEKDGDGVAAGTIKTYWPKNHMVLPKKKALRCQACHQKDSLITGQIDEIYIPANYGEKLNLLQNFDFYALIAFIATVLVVTIHGFGRIFFYLIRKTK